MRWPFARFYQQWVFAERMTAEFVSNAMQLYEKRKGQLIVNPAYRVDAMLPLYDEEDPLWGSPAGFDKGRPLYVESDEH